MLCFAVYNYRVRDAWEALQADNEALEDRVASLENRLLTGHQWAAEVEGRVLKSKGASGATIMQAVQALIADERKAFDNNTTLNSSTKAKSSAAKADSGISSSSSSSNGGLDNIVAEAMHALPDNNKAVQNVKGKII